MKDLMSDAFDGFWNESKPSKQKPKRDDTWDSIWAPKLSIPKHDASTGSKYIKNVRPVKYREDVMEAKSRVAKLQAEYSQKLLEDNIRDINYRRAERNIKNLKRVGRTTAETAKEVGQATAKAGKYAYTKSAPIIRKSLSSVTEFARKNISGAFVKKENYNKPVGLGGAIYEANKAAGRKSIYD